MDETKGRFYARLIRAILTEDVKDLQRIMRSPDQANAYDDTGRTPLHIAVMHSRSQAIGPLIDAGADSQLKSADRQSADEMAREKGGELQKHLKAAQKQLRESASKLVEKQLYDTGKAGLRQRIRIRRAESDQ
jgi:predicted component of type VI protein secretion system